MINIHLDQLVEIHEPMLQESWASRVTGRDVLILGELHCPEFARSARQRIGADAVDKILAAESAGRSPWLSYPHGPELIELMREAGGFENRSLAASLSAVALSAVARPGSALVPLLVVSARRAVVTGWAPPGSAAIVGRIAADLAHEGT